MQRVILIWLILKKNIMLTGDLEKVAKKVEKSEYEGFANGFPAWNLEPPQVAVRRKK